MTLPDFSIACLSLLITSACVPATGAEATDEVSSTAPEAVQSDPANADVTPAARVAVHPKRFSVSGELEQGGWIRGQVPEGAVTARLGDTPLAITADGRFFAAFDRDAGSTAELVAILKDGSTASHALAIAPRKWNLEHINAAKRPGGATSEAFWKIREPEYNRIVAARAVESDTNGWQQNFIWPVRGRISGRFGSQRIYRGEPGSYHTGLDIAPGAGTPFVAPADGVVVLAAEKPFSLEGHLIIIDHGQGLNSAFLHAASIDVKEGDVVKQGQRLGTVGMSGRATGPHLHWSIKWRDARLDPVLFLPRAD